MIKSWRENPALKKKIILEVAEKNKTKQKQMHTKNQKKGLDAKYKANFFEFYFRTNKYRL
jgi:hypothetical protein